MHKDHFESFWITFYFVICFRETLQKLYTDTKHSLLRFLSYQLIAFVLSFSSPTPLYTFYFYFLEPFQSTCRQVFDLEHFPSLVFHNL